MNKSQWHKLYQGFQTYDLLYAVDNIDELRRDFDDDDSGRPPELRTDLLKLHVLSMAVVQEGQLSQAETMFDLADDLSLEVHQLLEKLESVRDTLDKLLSFRPEDEADDQEED